MGVASEIRGSASVDSHLCNEIEEWKDIKSSNGMYQISNFGRLKSFHKSKFGRILSVKNKTGWYLTVSLCFNHHNYTVRIHRLVAEYFIPNPLNKREVNHKDMNKQNNYYKNLEWVSSRENIQHAIKNKPEMIYGMKYYNQIIRPKPVCQYTLSGRFIAKFHNCEDAGKCTGVCSRNIHQVASKTEYKPGLVRKQAGGFIWKFAEEAKNV